MQDTAAGVALSLAEVADLPVGRIHEDQPLRVCCSFANTPVRTPLRRLVHQDTHFRTTYTCKVTDVLRVQAAV